MGTRPSSYGNSGLNPSDPVLAGAFDLLPSQPRSQNNVLNPVVQPQPPLARPTPVIGAVGHLPPHNGGATAPNAGVIIVAPHPQVAPPPGSGGVVLAPPATPNGGGGAAGGTAPAPVVAPHPQVAPPPGGGGVVLASLAAPAPRGTLAHQRAQAARMVTQHQMADVAVGGNHTPTILTAAAAEQIWRGRGPDLDGTVGTLNDLLEKTQSMINSSLNAGARSSAKSPESKKICKFGNVTSRLEGLYKVRDMQIDQGIFTAAIDNAIAKLKSEF